MKRLLVSACLLGEPVRYDGLGNRNKVTHLQSQLQDWQAQQRLVMVCPEVLGGLTIPRAPAEMTQGGGEAVLNGIAHVITIHGNDVTNEFIRGAEKVLAIARRENINAALLAARSPSCGKNNIYNGQFENQLVSGHGVTTALLMRHGISCFNPEDADALIRFMEAK